MKLIVLLTLFLTSSAYAQRAINSQTFQANVRPALNAIINDFYQMVNNFPDFPKELYNITEQIESLHQDKEALRQKCPHLINQSCLSTINSLRNKLSNIDAKTLELQARVQMSSSLHISTLAGLRIIGEFSETLEEVKGELANSSFILKAHVPHHRKTFKIIQSLDHLNTLISLTIVEYIPFLYKEDFRQFYFNFVHPIELQISKNTGYEFLNRNVNSLNFAINLLNMTLTKRKKTPEGMAPYLSLIHNRWNSLLRYYF